MIIRAQVYLTRLVLAAVLLSLAAPATGAAAPATPAPKMAAIPAACRDAGGALVVRTAPFSRDGDKQEGAVLVTPDGQPLGQFPVAGALQLIPTPVPGKVIVPTARGETWIYDTATGKAQRFGAPTGGPRDYSSSPTFMVAGVYLLVLKADGWDIVDIRTGTARSLTSIAGPRARLTTPARLLVANGGADLLLGLAVGSSRNGTEVDPSLIAPGSYPAVVVPGDLAKAKLLDGFVYTDATAFSPDGRRLALLRSEPGIKQLYIRDLSTGEERRIDAWSEETRIGGLGFGGAGLVLLRNEDVITRPETVGGEAETIGRLDGTVIDGVVSPSGGTMVIQTIRQDGTTWTSSWWRLDQTTRALTRLKADNANVADGWPRDARWLLLTASGPANRAPAWAYALLDTETGRLTAAPAAGMAAFGRIGPISGSVDGIVAVMPVLSDGAARLDLLNGRTNQAWSVPIAGQDNGPYTLTMTSFSAKAACATVATTTVTEQQPLRTLMVELRPGATPVPLLEGTVIGWLPAVPAS